MSLNYRDFSAAVLIVFLAFFLRVVVVFDRAYGDPTFDPLRDGSDQLTYQTQAALYEQGKWPDAPFRYQPGITYYIVILRALVGESLGAQRILTSWTGAISVGLLIGAGWLLTRRKWGGYLAGLLMAVYPVAILHSTELLDPVLSVFYVGLFLFIALWQKERLALWRTVALGLITGLLMITRSNLMPIAFAWLVYLLWMTGLRRAFFLHGVVFAAAFALPIAPVTLWNIQSGGGAFQLVTNVGIDEIYRANNRDGAGTYYNFPPAWDTVVGGYGDALMTDIRLNPLRFIELQGRKIGLYWSNAEPANLIDYAQSGLAVSPLLRAIPLDFMILSIAGLLGLGVLLYENRRDGLFLALVNLMIFAGIMLIWVEGRLRIAAVPPLVLTAAYLLNRLPDIVRARRWRVLLAPALFNVVLFGFGAWALANLPHKTTVAALPADTHVVDMVYDHKLRFRGWRTLPDWTAPQWGWATYGVPYTVELFWELLEPVSDDYRFFLAYVDDGVRYAARDRNIGEISYPPLPTSKWQPGVIYSEIVGFRFQAFQNIPTERSGEIQVGVYLLSGQEGDAYREIIPVPVTSPEDAASSYAVLQRFAVVDLRRTISPPENAAASDTIFGAPGSDQIALKNYAIPANGKPGETVTFAFYWQALDDIREDYNLFIHVMDENDVLAAQHDGPPRDGAYVTSTWSPSYPVLDRIPIALPEKPGVYKVYIGLYHAQTRDRLPVDAPDYRPLLGEIAVGK